MPKLFPANHGHLLQTITSHFEMFKIFNSTVSQVSQLHHPSENPDKSSNLGFVSNEFEELHSSPSITQRPKLEPQQQSTSSLIEKFALQITNPWPEWVHLMEVLLKKGYFVEIGSPFGNDEMGSKDSNLVRTACLNFGRDRFDLIRYLSRRDIQIVVGFGCPSVDRKVVNSGKRLRALLGIDEGNVCSSCSLRGNCDRAYVKAREDEGGRTVDVMRILLTFGLDPITRSVENKPCQNETVKNSVRMLLNEMVEFSQKEPVSFTNKDRDSSVRDCSRARWKDQIEVPTKQGDWICPRCNFLNFAKNVKCLRCDGFFKDRLGKMSEDHDHLPLKKGDWICVKCHFLNFAKNSRCLRCQEKPPKRELNLGEWECDSCHYINFRRNTICLRCDYKRPKSSSYSNPSAEIEHEKGDNSPLNRMRFINELETTSLSTVTKGRRNQRRSSNPWSFVEDNELSAGNDSTLEFMDFPIQGGGSELSQNKDKIEEWKLEMAARKRNAAEEKAWDSNTTATRRSTFVECSDDNEIAEWFGQAKRASNKAD